MTCGERWPASTPCERSAVTSAGPPRSRGEGGSTDTGAEALLVSIHDVSPLTLDQSRRMVELAVASGVPLHAITVLVIPRHEDKVALARAWLRCWRPVGFWLNSMPTTWYKRPRGRGTSVNSRKGTFKAMDVVLKDPAARKAFKASSTRSIV